MNLNDILLNEQQMEHLYKQHLYQIDLKPNDEESTPISVQGSMHAGILWLVYEEKAEFLNDADTALLHKILQACQLTPGQIGLVNLYKSNQDIQEIAEKLNARTIIISGVPQEKRSLLNIPLYQISDWNGGKITCTDSIGNIGTNKDLKIQLWNSLRQIFNI